jgi:hypothetical protein
MAQSLSVAAKPRKSTCMIVVPPITKRSIAPSDRECVFIVSLATHIQSIQCGNDSAPRLY